MKPMFFTGVIIATLGVILIACSQIDSEDHLRACEHDCRKLSQEVLELRDKTKQQERFAILQFDDRNKHGQLTIPDFNPHTGSRIITKGTFIRDADDHVLYSTEYKHHPNP